MKQKKHLELHLTSVNHHKHAEEMLDCWITHCITSLLHGKKSRVHYFIPLGINYCYFSLLIDCWNNILLLLKTI